MLSSEKRQQTQTGINFMAILGMPFVILFITFAIKVLFNYLHCKTQWHRKSNLIKRF